MLKFFQETKGVISIFLTIIMLPTLTCAGIFVDGARVSAARTTVSGAGDLAMNAALSEYDELLLDVYGLFAMSEDIEELEKNVSLYFTNTINNEGILQSSDSYTRQFINSIGSMFSNGEIAFDNLINTETEDFSLQAIPSSALANPAVLERQILEHMKYRGPVSLGSGLITKLGCISETSKQTEVMEAKITYEQKLDVVQDVCQQAYEAIMAYEEEINNGFSLLSQPDGSPENIAGYRADNYIKTAYKYFLHASFAMEFATLAAIVYNDPDVSANINFSSNGSISSSAGEDIDRYVDVYDNRFTAVKNRLALNKNVEYTLYSWYTNVDFGSMLTPEKDEFYDEAQGFLAWYEIYKAKEADLRTMAAAIKYLNDQKATIKEKPIEPLIEIPEDATEEERTELEAENQKIQAQNDINDAYNKKITDAKLDERHSDVTAQLNLLDTLKGNVTYNRDKIITAIWYFTNYAYNVTNAWYDETVNIIAKLDTAITKVNSILDNIDQLKQERATWNTKLNNLSESEIKTTMQGDYNNAADSVNSEAVQELLDALTENKTHFEEIRDMLKETWYYQKDFCGNDSLFPNIGNYASDFYLTEFVGTDHATYESLTELRKQEIGKKHFTIADIESRNGQQYSMPKYYVFSKSEEVKGADFYKFLKNSCSTKVSTTTTTEQAKNERQELINNSNGEVSKNNSADLSDSTINLSGYSISPEILRAIESYTGATGVATNVELSQVDGSSDKNMANNAKRNISGVKNMLEGLKNIGKTLTEKVYLEEYFTEMFSCFTSTTENGDKETLHGDDMSENVYFGSEVEYLLYGRDTPKANLDVTKGSIFGVRFALNSIYALTSSYTRTPALTAATAIAGWTGFGVPIVQTVILLLWATAESAVDVTQICNNKDVVIYKTDATWVTGMNGLIDGAKDVADTVINNVFDSIENFTTDKIEQTKTDILNYVTSTTNGVVQSIRSTIMTNIETLVINLVGESNYNLTRDDVEREVDNMIAQMESSVQGDDIIAQATRTGINYIKTGKALIGLQPVEIHEYIIDTVYDCYTKAKNGINDEITTAIEDMLNTLSAFVEDNVNDLIEELGNDLVTATTDAMQKGKDIAKSELNNLIDQYTKDLGGIKMGDGTSKTGASIAAGLTLDYKEYLKTFTFITMAASNDAEAAMLKRCAELIQANIAKKNDKFDISKAYTMLKAEATVTVGTTFLDLPVATGVDEFGNTTYELDYSKLGSGRQTISYAGVRGY